IAPSISSTTARGAAAASLASKARATIGAKSARATHWLKPASTARAEAPVGAEGMGRLLVAPHGVWIGGDLPPRLLTDRPPRGPDMTSGGGRSIFTRAARLGKTFLRMLARRVRFNRWRRR